MNIYKAQSATIHIGEEVKKVEPIDFTEDFKKLTSSRRIQFLCDEEWAKIIPPNKMIEIKHDLVSGITSQLYIVKVKFYTRRKTYGGLIKLYGKLV